MADDNEMLLTRLDLAKQLGVTGPRVTHMVAAGKIEPEPGTKKLHLLRACQNIIDNTTDATAPIYRGAQRVLGIHALQQDLGQAHQDAMGPMEAVDAGSGQVLSFASARAKKEHYAALTAELQYQQQVGDLLPAGEVEAAAADAGRLVRDALLAIPDRCAAILAAEPDTNKVHELLLLEIEQALESL